MQTEEDGENREMQNSRAGPEERTPRIVVADLLVGAREVILVHNGEDYRLRITSKGRLILTK